MAPVAKDWPRRLADGVLKPAEKAVAHDPQAAYWNTLGVARYRAGNWQEATEALERSIELNDSPHAFDCFFLAMAHWQIGNEDEAFDWYHRAVEWTHENQPDNEELLQFQAEAKQLLQITADNPTTKQPD